MNNQKKIMIDASKIPNMKCYCGSEIYTQIFNLKYVSPILCNDPKGQTIYVMFWRCALCGQLYDKSKTLAEIEAIFNGLPPERKKFIRELKEQVQTNVKSTLDFLRAGGLKKAGGKK